VKIGANTVISTPVLGIGANTAIFSVVFAAGETGITNVTQEKKSQSANRIHRGEPITET
jgi:hypothetical protein